MKAQTQSTSEHSLMGRRSSRTSRAELDVGSENLSNADMDSRLNSWDDMTSAERRKFVQSLGQEVDKLRCELQKARDQVVLLANLVNEDTLVPLLNRRGFLRELEWTISYVNRYRCCVSLIYLDIDNFKLINDRFGHSAGDKALTEVARILMENTRTSDVIGRIGGDEFAIILYHASNAAAVTKAEQLATKIADETINFDTGDATVTITTGVAELAYDDEPLKVLSRADRIMYTNKQFVSISR